MVRGNSLHVVTGVLGSAGRWVTKFVLWLREKELWLGWHVVLVFFAHVVKCFQDTFLMGGGGVSGLVRYRVRV